MRKKSKNSDSEQSVSDSQAPHCRICLQQNLPLLQLPCKCKGSLGFVHEDCLSKFISKKEHFEGDEQQECKNLIHCDICTDAIDVQTSSQLRWQKIHDVKLQVYFILMSILVLSIFGFHMSSHLIKKVFEKEIGLFWQFQYLLGSIWIICVIFYVLLQPIVSQLKESKLKVKKCRFIWMRTGSKKKKYHN